VGCSLQTCKEIEPRDLLCYVGLCHWKRRGGGEQKARGKRAGGDGMDGTAQLSSAQLKRQPRFSFLFFSFLFFSFLFFPSVRLHLELGRSTVVHGLECKSRTRTAALGPCKRVVVQYRFLAVAAQSGGLEPVQVGSQGCQGLHLPGKLRLKA
jgi:hypothetical protein